NGCLLVRRKDQGEVSEKRAMVGRQRGYTAQAIEVNRPYLAPGPRLAISATTITLPRDRGEYEKNAAYGAKDQAYDLKSAPFCKRGDRRDGNCDLEHGHAAGKHFVLVKI